MIALTQFLVRGEKLKEPIYNRIDKTEFNQKYPQMNVNNHNYEIRQYEQFVLVSNHSTKQKPGFMPLARYIGVIGKAQNVQEQKMAMTTPVFVENVKQNENDDDDAEMHFVLPDYITDVEQAPKPNDSALRVHNDGNYVVAVKKFTWSCNQQKANQMLTQLMNELSKDGVYDQNVNYKQLNWKVAVYNGPFTIPFLRRNEVWIQLP